MKIPTTLGAVLLLGSLASIDPARQLWSAPAASTDASRAERDEHAVADHLVRGEAAHAGHDHERHAGQDHADGHPVGEKPTPDEHPSHDHAEADHDHPEPEDDHARLKHVDGDHDHPESVEDGHTGHDHAEGDHDDAKRADDDHAGHDHAQGRQSSAQQQADDHAGHEHDEGDAIRLAPAVLKEFGIEVRVAGGGSITRSVRLSGEVAYNTDRIAHVNPMVSGRVQQVFASVGDRVEAGQPMAVLASRELAAARSTYLAAVSKLELARENMAREQRLLSDKVGTTRAAAASKQAYREADIERNQAINALFALGYSRAQVAQTAELADKQFSTYELRAPLGGIVTQRHITIGEVIGLEGSDAPFVVADLSSVWVNLTVYPRDLAQVRPGMAVTVEFGGDIPDAQGTIAFVSPALDETTRTATARVVLEKPHADWRPGLFVSGHLATGHGNAAVLVPASAVTELDGETVVFVQTGEGFEPRAVRYGRSNGVAVEILEGLASGERYAANNVLALKAEANRSALEHAGHVH